MNQYFNPYVLDFKEEKNKRFWFIDNVNFLKFIKNEKIENVHDLVVTTTPTPVERKDLTFEKKLFNYLDHISNFLEDIKLILAETYEANVSETRKQVNIIEKIIDSIQRSSVVIESTGKIIGFARYEMEKIAVENYKKQIGVLKSIGLYLEQWTREYQETIDKYLGRYNFFFDAQMKKLEKYSQESLISIASIKQLSTTSKMLLARYPNASPEVLNIVLLSGIYDVIRLFAFESIAHYKATTVEKLGEEFSKALTLTLGEAFKAGFEKYFRMAMMPFSLPLRMILPGIGDLVADSVEWIIKKGIIAPLVKPIELIYKGFREYFLFTRHNIMRFFDIFPALVNIDERNKAAKLAEKYKIKKPPEIITAEAVSQIPNLLESQRVLLTLILETEQNIFRALSETFGTKYYKTQDVEKRIYLRELGEFVTESEFKDYEKKLRENIEKDLYKRFGYFYKYLDFIYHIRDAKKFIIDEATKEVMEANRFISQRNILTDLIENRAPQSRTEVENFRADQLRYQQLYRPEGTIGSLKEFFKLYKKKQIPILEDIQNQIKNIAQFVELISLFQEIELEPSFKQTKVQLKQISDHIEIGNLFVEEISEDVKLLNLFAEEISENIIATNTSINFGFRRLVTSTKAGIRVISRQINELTQKTADSFHFLANAIKTGFELITDAQVKQLESQIESNQILKQILQKPTIINIPENYSERNLFGSETVKLLSHIDEKVDKISTCIPCPVDQTSPLDIIEQQKQDYTLELLEKISKNVAHIVKCLPCQEFDRLSDVLEKLDAGNIRIISLLEDLTTTNLNERLENLRHRRDPLPISPSPANIEIIDQDQNIFEQQQKKKNWFTKILGGLGLLLGVGVKQSLKLLSSAILAGGNFILKPVLGILSDGLKLVFQSIGKLLLKGLTASFSAIGSFLRPLGAALLVSLGGIFRGGTGGIGRIFGAILSRAPFAAFVGLPFFLGIDLLSSPEFRAKISESVGKFWEFLKSNEFIQVLVEIGRVTFEGIKTGVKELWNYLKSDDFKKLLKSIWNGVVYVVDQIADYLTSPEFKQFLKDTGKAIWNGIVYVVDSVVDYLTSPEFRQLLKDTGKAILTGISDVISSIWNYLTSEEFQKDFQNFVGALVSGIWNGLTNFVSSIWNYVTSEEFRTGISNFIGGIWNGLTNFVSEIWKNITSEDFRERVKSLGESLWTGVTNFIRPIFDQVINIGASISNWFTTSTTKFLTAVGDFFNPKKWLEKVLETEPVKTIAGWFGFKKEDIEKVDLKIDTNQIQAGLQTVGQELNQTATNVLNTTQNLLNQTLEQVQQQQEQQQSAYQQATSQAETGIQNLQNTVTSFWDQFTTGFKDLTKDIDFQAIQNAWNTIQQRIVDEFNKISQSINLEQIKQAWENIQTNIGNYFTTISNQVSEFVNDPNIREKIDFNKISASIVEYFNKISDQISAYVNDPNIREKIDWTKIQEQIFGIWANAQNQWNIIREASLKQFQEWHTIIQQHWVEAQNFVIIEYQKWYNIITQQWSQIQTTVSTEYQKWYSYFQKKWTELKTQFFTEFDKIYNLINTQLREIQNTLSTKFKEISEQFDFKDVKSLANEVLTSLVRFFVTLNATLQELKTKELNQDFLKQIYESYIDARDNPINEVITRAITEKIKNLKPEDFQVVLDAIRPPSRKIVIPETKKEESSGILDWIKKQGTNLANFLFPSAQASEISTNPEEFEKIQSKIHEQIGNYFKTNLFELEKFYPPVPVSTKTNITPEVKIDFTQLEKDLANLPKFASISSEGISDVARLSDPNLMISGMSSLEKPSTSDRIAGKVDEDLKYYFKTNLFDDLAKSSVPPTPVVNVENQLPSEFQTIIDRNNQLLEETFKSNLLAVPFQLYNFNTTNIPTTRMLNNRFQNLPPETQTNAWLAALYSLHRESYLKTQQATTEATEEAKTKEKEEQKQEESLASKLEKAIPGTEWLSQFMGMIETEGSKLLDYISNNLIPKDFISGIGATVNDILSALPKSTGRSEPIEYKPTGVSSLFQPVQERNISRSEIKSKRPSGVSSGISGETGTTTTTSYTPEQLSKQQELINSLTQYQISSSYQLPSNIGKERREILQRALEAAPYMFEASKLTGLDFDTLNRIVYYESKYQSGVTNKFSGAYGYGQFMEKTWVPVVQRYAGKYGYTGSGPGGKITYADAMRWRDDKRLQMLMIGELAKENLASAKRMGINIDPKDKEAIIYLYHNLGAGQGTKFLKNLQSNPNQPVSNFLPRDVIAQNPDLYIDKTTGRVRTVAEAMERIRQVMQGGTFYGEEIKRAYGITDIASTTQQQPSQQQLSQQQPSQQQLSQQQLSQQQQLPTLQEIDSKNLVSMKLPEEVRNLRVKVEGGATKTLAELGVETFSDLQTKGGQAFAGGFNDPAVTYAMAIIQKEMGSEFKRVTAQNDLFHQKHRPRSEHRQGFKGDLTFTNLTPTQAHPVVQDILVNKLGLVPGKDFKLGIEDAGHKGSTGPHIDFKLSDSGRKKIAQLMVQQHYPELLQQQVQQQLAEIGKTVEDERKALGGQVSSGIELPKIDLTKEVEPIKLDLAQLEKDLANLPKFASTTEGISDVPTLSDPNLMIKGMKAVEEAQQARTNAFDELNNSLKNTDQFLQQASEIIAKENDRRLEQLSQVNSEIQATNEKLQSVSISTKELPKPEELVESRANAFDELTNSLNKVDEFISKTSEKLIQTGSEKLEEINNQIKEKAKPLVESASEKLKEITEPVKKFVQEKTSEIKETVDKVKEKFTKKKPEPFDESKLFVKKEDDLLSQLKDADKPITIDSIPVKSDQKVEFTEKGKEIFSEVKPQEITFKDVASQIPPSGKKYEFTETSRKVISGVTETPSGISTSYGVNTSTVTGSSSCPVVPELEKVQQNICDTFTSQLNQINSQIQSVTPPEFDYQSQINQIYGDINKMIYNPLLELPNLFRDIGGHIANLPNLFKDVGAEIGGILRGVGGGLMEISNLLRDVGGLFFGGGRRLHIPQFQFGSPNQALQVANEWQNVNHFLPEFSQENWPTTTTTTETDASQIKANELAFSGQSPNTLSDTMNQVSFTVDPFGDRIVYNLFSIIPDLIYKNIKAQAVTNKEVNYFENI